MYANFNKFVSGPFNIITFSKTPAPNIKKVIEGGAKIAHQVLTAFLHANRLYNLITLPIRQTKNPNIFIL